MKRLNKKGFTLIELLAVIVVLAIILAVAVPRVLDVIENARKESLGKSAQMAAKYLSQEYAIQFVQGTQPVDPITTYTACPPEVGFAAADGDCRYTLTLTGSEPTFTVMIKGAGRFNRWQATSINGAVPTIEAENLTTPWVPAE